MATTARFQPDTFDTARERFLVELLDERQVERDYGLKVGFLRKYRLCGGGPVFVKAGRSIRYSRRAILAYIESNTVASTTEVTARGFAHAS